MADADTNVCVLVFDDIPTLTVTVVAPTAVMTKYLLKNGSVPEALGAPDALGYVFCEALPSKAQVNVKLFGANYITSPTWNV